MSYNYLVGDPGVSPPIWQWAKSLVQALNTRDAAINQALAPCGAVVVFVGTVAPKGWLLCDGASYPVTTYPQLASLFGITSGNFNVPTTPGSIVKT